GEGSGSQLVTNANGCPDMGANTVLQISEPGPDGRSGTHLQDFGIVASMKQTNGVEFSNIHGWRIDHVFVSGVSDTAFKILASFGGTFINGGAEKVGQGLELGRIEPNGSGGVNVIGFLSSDISGDGIRVIQSDNVQFHGCEINTTGNGRALFVIGYPTN